ncbi:hypothetical protein B0H14DRAFT_3470179 [Mycena olivaceomarginata]|nr:hypothetical protein B0H14DRAFT_3470179 [Mycena olivaceomarginata]
MRDSAPLQLIYRPGIPPVRRTTRQCLILGHCFSAASATVFVAITFPLWQPSSQHTQSLARWQSDSAKKHVRTTLSIAPMRAQGSTRALAEGRAARLEREHLVAARRPTCACAQSGRYRLQKARVTHLVPRQD